MDPAQHFISHTSELTGSPLRSSTRALRGLHEHEISPSDVLRKGHQHYTQSSKNRTFKYQKRTCPASKPKQEAALQDSVTATAKRQVRECI